MSSPMERARKDLEGRAEYRAETPTYAMVRVDDLRALVRVVEAGRVWAAAWTQLESAQRRASQLFGSSLMADAVEKATRAGDALTKAESGLAAALRATIREAQP